MEVGRVAMFRTNLLIPHLSSKQVGLVSVQGVYTSDTSDVREGNRRRTLLRTNWNDYFDLENEGRFASTKRRQRPVSP